MLDIILAFLAVVGIALLSSAMIDAVYFKKRAYDFPLIVDLRKVGLEEAWSTMEFISQAQKSPGGKAILNNLYVLTSRDNPAVTEELAFHYLRVFDLSGTVFTDGEDWFAPYQNTPAKEGTKPS